MRPSPAAYPDPSLPNDRALELFTAAGFANPAESLQEWKHLAAKFPADASFHRTLPECWEVLLRSADPDLGVRQWSRWMESLSGIGKAAARWRWQESALFRESFLLVLAVSPSVGEDLIQLWEGFAPEQWESGWETPATLKRRLRAAAPPEADPKISQPEFLKALRNFQKLEEIRIAFLDECRKLPVEQITRQISWLADVLVERCLERAIDEAARRFQVPPPRGGFTVFALGKLGGLELNYSSDIDLIFFRTDGDPPLPNADGLYTKAAEKLVSLLSEYGNDRPLYRVDTRLRPEGSQGQLVWPVHQGADYYHSQGRTWERQALVRMRAIAGDMQLAKHLQTQLEPFIFRSTLTEDAIGDLHRLKAQIESIAETRGESADHVKIGYGGIRDVEFIVQYFQLLYGANHESLKNPNVFELLKSLERHGILNPEETDSLGRGYRFLRQVENRIQLNHRLQTHRLPEDAADLRRIVRGLGFRTTEAFQEHFSGLRARIRAVFRRLFESASTPETSEARLISLLELPLDLVKDQGLKLLEMYGFKNPREAFISLRSTSGEGTVSWDQFHAAESFRRLLPQLIRELIQYPDPDRALANFSECVSTLGARSVFFDLLNESPQALKLFVEVSAHSKYVVEILRGYPGLFDEVIDALQTGAGAGHRELLQEIAGFLQSGKAGPREERAFIFEQKHLHILIIALGDLERRDNLMTTMFHISQVAEAILNGALQIADRELRKKLGDLPGPGGEQSPEFAVLGLGKLGGEEMNYRSDLDLVFVYRGEGNTSRGYSTQEYYTRLAQEICNFLSESDAIGRLWETDVRLRPMGSKSLMAVDFSELQRYFTGETAQTWERLAFLRARPVAGDPALGKAATDFLRDSLPLRRGESAAAMGEEIREMRLRLEKSVPEGNIKRGEGGIVDVEFIVQALQLFHGRDFPGIITPNTAEGLRRLLDAGLMESQAGSELLSAYQFLRWLETRFSLLLAPEEAFSSMDQEKLRSLIQKIGYRSTGEEAPEVIFLEELRYHRTRNRSQLERILQR